MGGYGSGRWGWHHKRRTVEACQILDLGALGRAGVFKPGAGLLAKMGIRYSVQAVDETLVLVLKYTLRNGGPVEMPVRLEAAPMRFGGVRWCGRCPLGTKTYACGRRVRKIYLPPGGRYFGCRTCHRLTYKSAQEHDKRVDFLRRHPEALAAIVNNLTLKGTVTQLGLALKALDYEVSRARKLDPTLYRRSFA